MNLWVSIDIISEEQKETVEVNRNKIMSEKTIKQSNKIIKNKMKIKANNKRHIKIEIMKATVSTCVKFEKANSVPVYQ